MEWTNEGVLQFLDAYRAEPCIWDPHHPDHRNRNKVAEAWERLHKNLNFHCSINDIKKKKDSLMASFRMLLNKKKKAIESGSAGDEPFKPTWFAFEAMELFLAPVYHCIPKAEYIDTEIWLPDNEDPNNQYETILEGINNNGYNETDDVGNNKGGEEEDAEIIVPDKARIGTKTFNQQRTQKLSNMIKMNKNRYLTASEKVMDEAIYILRDTAQKKKEYEKDECDLYAELLARKLRKYNEEEREEIMFQIDSMLIKRKRMNIVDKTILPPTPLPTCNSIYTEIPSPSSSSSQYSQPVHSTGQSTENHNTNKCQHVMHYFRDIKTDDNI